VVTTLGDAPPIHPSLVAVAAGHPLPDRGSLVAGERARELLAHADPHDILLALVSGGGSAMFELLVEGVALEDLRALNDLLIRSGATVREINTVRKALSRVKGGGLARLASPARTIGLILSDVVGDPLSSVASGPTVLHAPRPGAARRVLEIHRLWDKTSPGIRAALEGGGRGERPRTPRPLNLLVGSSRTMVQAVLAEAAGRRLRPRLLTGRMEGEAREVGGGFARRLLRAPPPACLVMGGETTVTVRGKGRGGRNQELALAAALELEGVTGAAVMALATDGIDGPTDAAGAWVEGSTVSRALEVGFDPRASLRANDSYPLLHAVDALLTTGPTGTNVGDLVVGIRL
jgi:hydroxypyruvate reductase